MLNQIRTEFYFFLIYFSLSVIFFFYICVSLPFFQIDNLKKNYKHAVLQVEEVREIILRLFCHISPQKVML